MVWLGKHWKATEFACNQPESPCDCSFTEIHPLAVEIADLVRGKLGVPLRSNSACRCSAKNKKVGGRSRSLHLRQTDGFAHAIDLTFVRPGLRSPARILRLALAIEGAAVAIERERGRKCSIGMGIYPWGVHFDVRGEVGRPPARWSGDFPYPPLK